MRKMKFLGLTLFVLIVLAIPVSSWIPVQKISTHPDNVYTNDMNPQIATDASGNSYVAWRGHDGNDHEIYWVKIDASGVPGTVQKISTHPDNVYTEDTYTRIATDASGNSYVAWRGHDGHDYEIYWVKIDATGVPGTVLKISTHPHNLHAEDRYLSLAVDASGDSYVIWQGVNSSRHEWNIYLARIDATGVPGAVQRISTHPDNIVRHDYDPQIALDASGNSYVTWQGYGMGCGYEIYWMKIDSSGVPGSVQKISTHVDNMTSGDWHPRIAVDASGNSYVTWQGRDSADREIYWAKVDSSGVPGSVLKISTHPDNINNDDRYPSRALDSSGTSYVTWWGWDGNDWEIYWVKVDSSGVPGSVLKISTHPDNVSRDDRHPQIATDASGNSYVTWYGHDGNDYEIYWVKIDASGVPGAVQKISTHPDNANNANYDPQIAADASRNSYVTWWGFDGNDYEIYFVSYLVPITSNIQVSPNPTNCASTVTVTAIMDDSGAGNSNIQQAEYFIDIVGPNGTGTPMAAQDGTFDSPTETVTAVIDVTGLSQGAHTIYVHGQNALGNWGGTESYGLTVIHDCIEPVTSNVLITPNPTNCASTAFLIATVDDSGTGNNNVQQAEYFIDVIGKDGTGTPMTAVDCGFDSPTEYVIAVIDVTRLPGSHTLYVHGQDSSGNWGPFQSVSLSVTCQKTTETDSATANEQMRPLAQYNISAAEDLSAEVEDLLSEAKAKGLDTSECEKLIRKAEELLTKAKEYFKGKDYIAANNYALEAVEAYQKAIDLLIEFFD